jgi:AcrR family transcriptional regulator
MAILDAAAHEFAVEGYRAAALSRIHERSGVTKGAMYFHFASKEAVGTAVAEVFEARLPEVLAQRSADGLDALTTAVSVAVGFAELLRDEAHCRAGLRVVTDGALGARRARWPYAFWEGAYADLLESAQQEGSLRGDVDTAELARTMVATGVGHWAVSAATAELADVRERTAASWSVLLSTAADPAWLERWYEAGGVAAIPGMPGTARTGVPDGAAPPVP